MNLTEFLQSKKYDPVIKNILLDIQNGSIAVYKKLNEENGNILGASGLKNIQDEEVQKLDLIANDIFIQSDVASHLTEKANFLFYKKIFENL